MKAPSFVIPVLFLLTWQNTVAAQDWSWLDKDISIPLENEFYAPTQLDFDRDGNMYICDAKAARIFKIGTDGRLLYSLGRKGEGPGEFEYPYDLVIDRNNERMWVCDYFQNKLLCFDLEGYFLFQKKYPFGLNSIACRSDGMLVLVGLTIHGNLALVETDGEVVSHFGYKFSGSYNLKDKLNATYMIMVDKNDQLYAANLNAPVIYSYDSNQKELWNVERPWTNLAEGPLPYADKENGFQSSKYHSGLFVKDGVLYISTGFEELTLLAFETRTGNYLGYRKMNYRARNMKYYQGNIYTLESQNSVLHIYPVGKGPVFKAIKRAENYSSRTGLLGSAGYK